MSIATHRGIRVKGTLPAEHWPAWTDEHLWSLTVAGQLAGMPVGDVETINGRVVARRSHDGYEIVSYGHRVLDRSTAHLLLAD